MEEISYRNTKLQVKTIPKGTVLFRQVSRKNQDEIRGVPVGEERCISNNHNIFFYPNPFVAKIALNTWSKDAKHMSIYVLTHDVKVLWLLKPSKYSRLTKNTKRTFIKRCHTVKGCLPYKSVGMHAKYNPCMSDTMIKKHPEVTGMIGLAVGDAQRVNEGMKKQPSKITKYFHLAEDTTISSVPELILYPLTKRRPTDLYVKKDDELDNAYEYLKTYSVNDVSGLTKFMDGLEYDPNTFFYKMNAKI